MRSLLIGLFVFVVSGCITTAEEAKRECAARGLYPGSIDNMECARALASPEGKFQIETELADKICGDKVSSMNSMEFDLCMADMSPDSIDRWKFAKFAECKRSYVDSCLGLDFHPLDQPEETRDTREVAAKKCLELTNLDPDTKQWKAIESCLQDVKGQALDMRLAEARSELIEDERNLETRRELRRTLRRVGTSPSEQPAIQHRGDCSSDFECGTGEACVKPQYQNRGFCATKVDDYGNPTFTAPSLNSVGVRTDSACRFDSDCQPGFQCISDSCVRHEPGH